MKNFNLYTEELNFEEREGKNITVGSYETENFPLCPGATEAFTNLIKEPGVDMAKAEEAAKHVDESLAIEAKALERGYSTEKDLEDILLTLPLDVRILGVEYRDKEFTGRDICVSRDIELIYNKRDHSFSSSSLRKRVVEAESKK